MLGRDGKPVRPTPVDVALQAWSGHGNGMQSIGLSTHGTRKVKPVTSRVPVGVELGNARKKRSNDVEVWRTLARPGASEVTGKICESHRSNLDTWFDAYAYMANIEFIDSVRFWFLSLACSVRVRSRKSSVLYPSGLGHGPCRSLLSVVQSR